MWLRRRRYSPYKTAFLYVYKAAVIAVHQLQLFVPATTTGKSAPLARSEEESLFPARTEGPTNAFPRLFLVGSGGGWRISRTKPLQPKPEARLRKTRFIGCHLFDRMSWELRCVSGAFSRSCAVAVQQ